MSTETVHTSMPFVSILSYLSGFVQYKPAYRFLLMRRYGKYTFSNSSLIGLMNLADTISAASAPEATQLGRWKMKQT